MKIVTIEIPDEVLTELEREAEIRQVTLEEVAARTVVMAHTASPPPLHTKSRAPKIINGEESSIIGLFADSPEVGEAIRSVVALRHEKYSGLQ